MPSLRYFAEREVQNGDSHCFLIVSSFHVLIIEAPCTDLETICNYVHDFMSSGVLIPTQDCWFKHHIDISLENPPAVKYVHPVELSRLSNCDFTNTSPRGKHHLKWSPSSPLSLTAPSCLCYPSLRGVSITAHSLGCQKILAGASANGQSKSPVQCWHRKTLPAVKGIAQCDPWLENTCEWHLAVKLHTPPMMFSAATTWHLSRTLSAVTSSAKISLSFMCRDRSSTS